MQHNDRPCPKCHEQKDIEEFGHRVVNGVKCRQSYCKHCRTKPPVKPRKPASDPFLGNTYTNVKFGSEKGPGSSWQDVDDYKTSLEIEDDVKKAREFLWKRYIERYPNDKAGSKPTGRSVNFMTKKLARATA